MRKIAVVILAAGKGTRMKDDSKPKVLFEVAEKPMIGHIIETSAKLAPEFVIPVVGYLKEDVISYCKSNFPDVGPFAVQDMQLGTGHAVMQAEKALSSFEGDILILAGDVPLISEKTLLRFRSRHSELRSDCTVLSTSAPNPFGYGRIVRDESGDFEEIIEEKDADDAVKKIDEINSGIFLVDSKNLFAALSNIDSNNAQAEYYLTDIIKILRNEGKRVFAVPEADIEELQGVNSKEDLAEVEKRIRSKKS